VKALPLLAILTIIVSPLPLVYFTFFAPVTGNTVEVSALKRYLTTTNFPSKSSPLFFMACNVTSCGNGLVFLDISIILSQLGITSLRPL